MREVLSHVAPGTGVDLDELSPERLCEPDAPGSPTILVNDRDLFPTG